MDINKKYQANEIVKDVVANAGSGAGTDELAANSAHAAPIVHRQFALFCPNETHADAAAQSQKMIF